MRPCALDVTPYLEIVSMALPAFGMAAPNPGALRIAKYTPFGPYCPSPPPHAPRLQSTPVMLIGLVCAQKNRLSGVPATFRKVSRVEPTSPCSTSAEVRCSWPAESANCESLVCHASNGGVSPSAEAEQPSQEEPSAPYPWLEKKIMNCMLPSW
jgi:hypothetical protein